ncbi:MAG: lysophospholipid acyltransferase family protein [Paracoccaceae bacterium]
MRWVMSLIFVVQMYLALAILALVFTPVALVWRGASFFWLQLFCRYVRVSARVLVGLRSEVRGVIPTGAVLIASKHQSFFDTIILFSVLDASRFIMKRVLIYVPLAGWHALRIGCIPVDRGKRGAAIKKMVDAVEAGAAKPGQLIIYPQGTRIAPGVVAPYKIGTAALYTQLGQVCVPVGTNVGVFWPKHGILRKPGLAVVEFLPPIAPGMEVAPFMAELEARIEASSTALMAEAGFKGA